MSTDNDKITMIYCFFLLVMIKDTLYERTVAVCRVWTLGKVE